MRCHPSEWRKLFETHVAGLTSSACKTIKSHVFSWNTAIISVCKFFAVPA